MSTPKLEILPQAQRRLWNELKNTPQEFVLYGGTALALRLGHRTSEDFDFFSNRPFLPDVLRKTIAYLHDAEMRQFEENTLTAVVNRDGPVKVSFFGGLKLNRVRDPDVIPDNGIKVASLLDGRSPSAKKVSAFRLRAPLNVLPAIQSRLRTLASQVNLEQIPLMRARVGVTGAA
jgi:hypothetical protein